MRLEVGRTYYLVSGGKLHKEKTITVDKINYPTKEDTLFRVMTFEAGNYEPDPVTVTGILGVSGKRHTFGYMWLQKSPELMKKKYNKALKYYKKTGNGLIRQLSEKYMEELGTKAERREVMIAYVEQTKDATLVHYIDSNGMQCVSNIRWFDNVTRKDMRKYTRDTYIAY